MIHPYLRATLVALALILISPASSAFAADPSIDSGGISMRIAQISSIERDNPLARIYLVDHLEAESTMTRRIEVSNTSKTDQFVSLYAAAAEIRNGEFAIADGRTANELTSWVRVTPAFAQIAPGGYQTVEVTIDVPPNARAGMRYGVIWAEMSSSQSSSSLVNVNRVGIRMMIPIGKFTQKISHQSRSRLIGLWIKKNLLQSPIFDALLVVNLFFFGKKWISRRLKMRRRRVFS